MTEKFGEELILLPYKGRINQKYSDPDLINVLNDIASLLDTPECEILHLGRNRIGKINIPLRNGENIDVVIKEYRAQGIDKLKSLFVPSKAYKAWRGSSALVQAGITTPLPVAYLEKHRGLFLDQSFFLTEIIREAEEIRYLFRQLAMEEMQTLLNGLAGCLSACHKRGILHRDLSDGNILVKKDKGGKFQYYIIDTNRIRLKKKIPVISRIKNLIRLGIPPGNQRYFLEAYLGVSKIKGHLLAWYRMTKAVYTWYVEMKNKLRLKQIAQKLKIQ